MLTMSMRKIYYRLSPGMRLRLRRLWYLPYDVRHARERKRKMIPPRGLIYTGSGDFLEVGQRFLDHFITYADLKPHHHVLDVGSGIGRMAVALTQYLSPQAQYEGFDVVKRGVMWCRKHITPHFPNFHFRHADLANDLYTSGGGKASAFQFPYEDSRFDRTIVISVFTHMVRPEVERYLSEVHRTLKPGGVAFATFFILNDEARRQMKEGAFRFDHYQDGCWLMDPGVRSANVAYMETDLIGMSKDAGLNVDKILYGKWSGRQDQVTDFQDIVIMRRS